MHADNLVAHVRGEPPRATSRELGSRTFALDLPRGELVTAALDLRDVLDEPLGLYRLEASATDQRWTSDSCVVAVTDLGLCAKRERDGYLVWVSSLARALPVEGVAVAARSYNNQLLAAAVTDGRGLARLEVPPDHPDGAAYVITAERGGDLAYLQPDRGTRVARGVDTAGRRRDAGLDVLLYTERDVYRPGDVLHLSGVVRGPWGELPESAPVDLAVSRPDGQRVWERRVQATAEEQGLFHAEVPTAPDARTGPYRIVALHGETGAELARIEARVEAFLPARIELTAEPVRERFLAGEEPALEVEARYLFDQPAAGLPLLARCAWTPVGYRSAAHPGFTFPGPGSGVEGPTAELEARLDPAGRTLLALPPPPDPGLWRGRASLTVSELGGRSVSRAVSLAADTLGHHLGLRIEGGEAPLERPFDLHWILLDADDAAAPPAAVAATLSRVHREARVERVNGRAVWRTEERLEELGRLFTDGASSRGRLELRCPEPGAYRVTASVEGSARVTSLDFSATREGGGAFARARATGSAGAPEAVELRADRERYAPGDTARLLVRSPFAGTLLLTLETDRVLLERVVALDGPEATVALPLPAELRGDAFVSATVVRPLDPADLSWTPHRAHGLARLATDHGDSRLAVAIEAPEGARPGERVRVAVSCPPPPAADPQRPPARVHLWAVDEGLLLAGATETPDPHGHFFAPRRAGVETTDSYGELLPDHRRPAAMVHVGGDAAPGGDGLRRGPVPLRAREPAVVWLRSVPLDAAGRAALELELPDLRGRLRLMAVALDGDRYGSAERPITLATPVLAEVSWPRFAAPGDLFDVPVKLINTTAEARAVEASWVVAGPLALVPEAGAAPCVLAPGEERVLWWRARAGAAGEASAEFVVQSGGDADRQQRALLVRRPAPLQAETRTWRLEAGESLAIPPPESLEAGGLTTRVVLGGDPELELQPALEMLLDYPYGCVEQTTSRLFALLHAPGAVDAELLAEAPRPEVRAMIEAGLDRLWAMQTRSGGLAYWPGGSRPDRWGSAYAGELLAAARREGLALRPELVEPLLDYLDGELRGGAREDGQDGADLDLRALLCRVLAGFDRPNPGWMARLSERADELDMAGRAHLAAAWLASGRRDRALEVLTADTLRLAAVPRANRRITSQVRQEGVLLGTLIDLDPKSPWIPGLVRRLEEARSAGRWGNTLENATALAALARYQGEGRRGAWFAGSLTLGAGEPWPFEGPGEVRFRFADRRGPIAIETRGEGPVYVVCTEEGLAAEGHALERDAGLVVRRRWLDGGGAEVDPRRLAVGQLVHVELSLAAPGLGRGESVPNVAVVDALPGGLEVENPALATAVPWTGAAGDVPDRVEFLDDRVLLFASAGAEPRVFRYALRAVASGRFALPAVQASSMYDAGLASVHGAGEVQVER